MKKFILIAFCFITFFKIDIASAQKDTIDFNDNPTKTNKKKLSDKVFFGGTFGLQFGTVTSVNISPVVGYRIIPQVECGFGASFDYYRNSFYDYQFTYYGANAFVRYFPVKNFFIQGSAEMLNVEPVSSIAGLGGSRVWIPGLLAGGGYRQMLGQKFGSQITFLYNFTMTENTPYENPILQIDFIF
jgi:hypothetical protein